MALRAADAGGLFRRRQPADRWALADLSFRILPWNVRSVRVADELDGADASPNRRFGPIEPAGVRDGDYASKWIATQTSSMLRLAAETGLPPCEA
jgi:hypothetical protein